MRILFKDLRDFLIIIQKFLFIRYLLNILNKFIYKFNRDSFMIKIDKIS